jgi:RNA polymerase sigma-70 factor (ECF subfamily)
LPSRRAQYPVRSSQSGVPAGLSGRVGVLVREPRILTRLRRGDSAPDKSPTHPPAAVDSLSEAVLAAQAGSEQAFSEVYRTVQPGLLRYLYVLVGRDAEDLASETWMHVCRDLATFTGDGDGFRGWVTTIGRHRALDHLRSKGRRPSDPLPWESLLGVPGLDDTEIQAEESISTVAALALISQLPRDQAEAVLLRSVIGMDAKTAALVLGKSPGAVRTSAYRGLKNLAATLRQDQGDQDASARCDR